MIIKIKSKNTNLFDILNKNPNTDNGLYGRTIRGGVAIGICEPNSFYNEYQIIYQGDRNSFSDYENSSINFKGMCSPEIWLNINQDFFDHLKKPFFINWLNVDSKDIDTQECTINLSNIWIDSGWYRNGQFLLSKYIPEIKCNESGTNLYNLEITCSSVKEAIDLMSLTCFLIGISNRDGIYIQEDLVIKYADKICSLNLPYFVYYLFIKRIGKSEKSFNTVKEKLETHFLNSNGLTATFTKNDTHGDRIEWVRNNIEKGEDIFDYGCGEHVYFKSLYKKVNSYKSFDIQDYSTLYQTIKQRYNKVDWIYYKPEWLDTDEVIEQDLTIIMSEVWEHCNLDELSTFVARIKEKLPNIKKWLITTPDKDFNVHYGLGETLRREDHVWELTHPQFQDLIKTLFPNYKIEFCKIGNIIDNISVTSGAIITL